MNASVFSSPYLPYWLPLLCDAEKSPLSGLKDLKVRDIKFNAMAKVDETIRRFWHKHIVSFYPYFPARFKNVGESNEMARQLVYAFKSGERYEEVAQMTAKQLKEEFGDRVSEIVFTCIPASTAEKNELRYKKFSELVCQLSGAINGYDHIKVTTDINAVHDSHKKRSGKADKMQNVDIDGEWFRNRNVVTMDDVLTTAASFASLGSRLEEFGANILTG